MHYTKCIISYLFISALYMLLYNHQRKTKNIHPGH
nr:MAG TPA: hypothetical protein [Caudoviricetes sp.]